MQETKKIIKTGGMLLLTLLVTMLLLLVLPGMVNYAGWIGFFVAPVIGFAVTALLLLAWVSFIKKTFKGATK